MVFARRKFADHSNQRTLAIETVIDFLLLFSGIWFLEGKIWNTTRALMAAGGLCLSRLYHGQRAVLLTNGMNRSDLASAPAFTKLARSIIADISKFHFHPFIQRVVEEMVQDANSLFSAYLLSKRRTDVARKTRVEDQ
jgi:hypothetical protein